MPRDLADFEGPLDIAVVGTGIAGLSAAWLLARRHRVTVYEQDRRVGGHSNTVDVQGPDGPIAVDTGFIVYNETNYPNLTALFDHIDVPTKNSTMSFAASIGDGAVEYSGGDLAGLFAQPGNLLRPGFWRMLRDILRFYRKGPGVLSRADRDQLTLGAYLDGEGYSREFIDHHLLPMAAAIWSSPVDGMRDHPAVAFVRFCMTHGLMRIGRRPQWRTVEGGSRTYVRKLTATFADRIRTGRPVVRVRRLPESVTVEDESGNVERFDHIVVAAHADQALAMLADASFDERRLLGAFAYSSNRTVLHRDQRLMPKRRRVWSSWNYIAGRPNDRRPRVCVTYWMNALQSLDPRVPLFVTLNPAREPAPELVEAVFHYDHPCYHRSALRAQRELPMLQGVRNTWFCGSYFGAGFHEDALVSGLAVAEALGGVRRPWATATAAEPLGRLRLERAAE
ncbi:MAG TPA: FAD-dependent oxidoreductase [Rhodospirillales bacterium]|nr:FAD-dependent oxidoreductase [Rhodospirillales bacterium]